MKKNFLALGTCAFALALGFAACDDSTSANGSSGDENPAEVSSSSILTTSSPTEDPGSSSSSVIPSTGSGQALSGGSAGVEGSSSSVISSSSVESSSSVVSSSSEKSSSSVASSSSVKSSSSVASSSSTKSSSSSVVSSSSSSSNQIKDPSSSSVASSSSMKVAWAYLNPDIDYGTMTDTRDGQVYKTIVICDDKKENCQTWMAENLNYDPDPDKISSMGSHAWSGCYNNESANCSKYGRLYTWEVAMDNADCTNDKKCNASLKPATPVRGVCPSGWHLPSHYEFEQLINFIAPTFGYSHTDDAYSSTAGQYLKSLSGWNSSGNGSDAYGFSALPGGRRNNSNGYFDDAGAYAYFWSSGEHYSYGAFYLNLDYDYDDANLYWDYKYYARSVRCLQD